MLRRLPLLTFAAAMMCGQIAAAAAETCAPETFGAAVDAAAASLRGYNAEAQPRLKQKLAALKDKRGWDDASYEEKSRELLHDGRTASLDTRADELLTKIDTLGRPEPGTIPACADLSELKASGEELLAVMHEKTAYLDAKIERELGSAGAGSATPAEKLPEKAAAPKKPAAEPRPAVPPAAKPEQKKPADNPVVRTIERPRPWDTKTAEAPNAAASPPAPQSPPPPPPPPPPGEPYALPPDAFAGEQDGYSIDEIREASRGFFGTLSTNLGSVIEHAFRKSGRPTAYVLGNEGGGAFLAGVRYGNGTLYLRSGGTEKVYWHGPSIGSDIGAEDSRTLFLIYRLKEPAGLYRDFTGIDGSAYLVGGVGITFLKGGEVIMAPIRSGFGLRLGASIGYVRFTPRPTWNPF
jgi:hypothetical protein